MRLRIRHREGIATLTQLTSQSTLLDLHSEIAKEIKAPVSTLELKFGYPPKLLVLDNATAHSSLDSLGIKDGEQILTSERPVSSAPTFDFSSQAPFITVSSKDSQTATPPTAAAPRVAASTSGTVISGAFAAPSASAGSGGGAFGSRPVVQPTNAQSTFQARTTSENAFGGLSMIDSFNMSAPVPGPLTSTTMSNLSVEAVRVRDQGLLVVREVADDNSCLFNAIAYTLDPSMKSNVKGLRQIVADAIDANPDAYPDVVLGRPRKEYCDWIRKENSWGGAIELAIFSDHYKIEIDSIDVLTNRVDRFGEGQYRQRALVMYSGIHYDAVALTPSLHIPADCDQTQFEVGLEDVITAGTQLAAKLKKAHKYTDLATFTLRCSICKVGLKGEKDAQQHAQQTMHTSFEEFQ